MRGDMILCEGGPYDGMEFPASMVQHSAIWVPRADSGASGPFTRLTEQEARRQPHYVYAGVRLGKQLHVYEGAET